MKNPRYLVGIFFGYTIGARHGYKPGLFVGVNLIDDVTAR